jgi:hypothetical protein
MPLPLPGETCSRPRLIEVLIAAVVVVGLCSLGCATAPVRGAGKADEGATFVARALRKGGLRFGTDGSTRALWGYLRATHVTVAPPAARPGDVLFFDTRPGDAAPDCNDVTDHAGLVEAVEPDGRIVFVEARGGQVRRSVVDPARPTLRRNERGEIANSFLRPKRVADPPNARYFAGQMLCGVARVDR